jgi:hypothetical protein
MPMMMVEMCCPICGRHWEVEAVWDDDSAWISDDLCPECQSQGDPCD